MLIVLRDNAGDTPLAGTGLEKGCAMLDEVHVHNVALIRDATFAPTSGLTVITGESGAGKTALLEALKLLVGERADSATVREGATFALVEGRFFLDVPEDGAAVALDAIEGSTAAAPDGDESSEQAFLADSSAPADACVVRRRVGADGRSRVNIDGAMATVSQLASTVGSSVDLCGQHEHQHLLKVTRHAALLDAWAGAVVQVPLKAYRTALVAALEAERELARVQQAAQASSEQLSQARFVLAQIDEARPSQEEYDQIMRDLPRVENAEALAQAAQAAHAALSREGGAVDATHAAIRALEQAARIDSGLSGVVEALTDASYALEDAARDVRVYREGIEHDPAALERMQERAGTLQGLMRTYGPRMHDVLARREEAARTVAAVDDAANLVARAQAALDAAEAELAARAQALDEARAQAAPRFAEAVNRGLARLEMGTAELVCTLEALPRPQWTRTGPSKVEFLYRPAEGMTARPLARIASGGEMSRVMLACKVALGSADPSSTLVFDEVDAGVGGSAARALAAVLVDLAATHQVIVVTHLAQVAVFGEAHYLVRKIDGRDGLPETELALIEGDERVAEVARMLSGDARQASKAHAAEMLTAARTERERIQGCSGQDR